MLQLQEHIDLLPYNTFHVLCIARYFVVIRSVDDVRELLNHTIRKNTAEKLFLGGWSNMVFIHETFDGLVIKNEVIGKQTITETETQGTITVWAWENRNDFVRRTLQNGYRWLENLVSIPGTAGAAPIQNIGAYGIEVERFITSVRCIDTTTAAVCELTHEQCKFGYRTSLFKREEGKNLLVLDVTVVLPKYTPQTYTPVVTYAGIHEKLALYNPHHREWSEGVGTNSDTDTTTFPRDLTPLVLAAIITDIRAEKLPDRHELGTAWSFFQNPIVPESQYQMLKEQFPDLVGRPVSHPTIQNPRHPGQTNEMSKDPGSYTTATALIKLSAGQLIEKAWFKGVRHGNMGVYEKHALVLVNYWGGTGKELQELILQLQENVHRLFSVGLDPEVNML